MNSNQKKKWDSYASMWENRNFAKNQDHNQNDIRNSGQGSGNNYSGSRNGNGTGNSGNGAGNSGPGAGNSYSGNGNGSSRVDTTNTNNNNNNGNKWNDGKRRQVSSLKARACTHENGGLNRFVPVKLGDMDTRSRTTMPHLEIDNEGKESDTDVNNDGMLHRQESLSHFDVDLTLDDDDDDDDVDVEINANNGGDSVKNELSSVMDDEKEDLNIHFENADQSAANYVEKFESGPANNAIIYGNSGTGKSTVVDIGAKWAKLLSQQKYPLSVGMINIDPALCEKLLLYMTPGGVILFLMSNSSKSLTNAINAILTNEKERESSINWLYDAAIDLQDGKHVEHIVNVTGWSFCMARSLVFEFFNNHISESELKYYKNGSVITSEMLKSSSLFTKAMNRRGNNNSNNNGNNNSHNGIRMRNNGNNGNNVNNGNNSNYNNNNNNNSIMKSHWFNVAYKFVWDSRKLNFKKKEFHNLVFGKPATHPRFILDNLQDYSKHSQNIYACVLSDKKDKSQEQQRKRRRMKILKKSINTLNDDMIKQLINENSLFYKLLDNHDRYMMAIAVYFTANDDINTAVSLLNGSYSGQAEARPFVAEAFWYCVEHSKNLGHGTSQREGGVAGTSSSHNGRQSH